MCNRAPPEAEDSCELTRVHKRTVEEVEFRVKRVRGLGVATPILPLRNLRTMMLGLPLSVAA